MANPDADKHVRNVTKSLVCPGSALEPRTIVEQKSMHPYFCRGAHEEKTSLLKIYAVAASRFLLHHLTSRIRWYTIQRRKLAVASRLHRVRVSMAVKKNPKPLFLWFGFSPFWRIFSHQGRPIQDYSRHGPARGEGLNGQTYLLFVSY